MRVAVVLGVVTMVPLVGAAAQRAPQPQRCLLVLLGAERQGVSIEVAPGVTNYFVGGNVRFRCQGLEVFMRADSVASYQGSVVQFIGNVRYRDTVVEMTANFGTYLRGSEKWEARERVVYRNLRDGTTLRGPMLDYFRAGPGLRDEAEMFADRRPTVTIPVRDSVTGELQEPYEVIGDRIRTRGSDWVFAGGRVTIARSDFHGRGDSLFLNQGQTGEGALIGSALLRRTGEDTLRLEGRRIDFELRNRRLTRVTARDSARLAGTELSLRGDAIELQLAGDAVERATAWGDTLRPVARSAEYEVRGDSVTFDMPGGVLRELRGFGRAWVGARPDTGTGERDWIEGDTVVARFVERDSAGTPRTTLQRVQAVGTARAYYRLQVTGQPASVSYSKADRIEISLRIAGDSVRVDSVIQVGNVQGTHLQAAPPTARRDTVPPAGPGAPARRDAPLLPAGRPRREER
jgi:hypothetical protein